MKRAKNLATGLLLEASFVACDKDPVGQQINELQLTLSSDSVAVRVSETSAINVTIRNASGAIEYATVKFVSRNPSVAGVNVSGTINAVAVGSTYVVATHADRPD